MINELYAYAFCNEEISNIEKYKEALEDENETWVCHHKLELHNDYRNTVEEMKLMNLYYNRPACELIFMRRGEHTTLHCKGKSLSEEHKANLSKAHLGNSGYWTGKKRIFTEEHKANLSKAMKLYRNRKY